MNASLSAGPLGRLFGQSSVGFDQSSRTTQQEGDLGVVTSTLGQQHDASEGIEVVFNGLQGMIQAARDLLRFKPLKIKSDSLDTMRLSGPDVLLLSATGDDEFLFAEPLDIADDGAITAAEQPVGEVFVAEQSALLTGLGTQAEDTSAAEGVVALLMPDVHVVFSGVEGDQNGDFLTLRERLAGGFVGGYSEKLHLPDAEIGVAMMGVQSVDILGHVEDSSGHKRRAVGSFLNPPTKKVVERFRVQSCQTQFVFDDFGPNHIGTSYRGFHLVN